MREQLKIIGISGSLRRNSSATTILRQVGALFPSSVDFDIYEGVGKMPHFDDDENAANEVDAFRELLAAADGVIISQPEYAYGVAGSLKNALDWTVSSGTLVSKPVALITAATGGQQAHESMQRILGALSARTSDATNLLIPFVRSKLNEKGEINSEELKEALSNLVTRFISLVKEKEPAE